MDELLQTEFEILMLVRKKRQWNRFRFSLNFVGISLFYLIGLSPVLKDFTSFTGVTATHLLVLI